MGAHLADRHRGRLIVEGGQDDVLENEGGHELIHRSHHPRSEGRRAAETGALVISRSDGGQRMIGI